jgi:SAM-dependent methyltransferase
MNISSKAGILLDIGCGSNKRKGFVGMDKRAVEGVDIVHDLEVFPYPLEDESCLTIVGSHIVEHIKPWLMIEFMDELWRLLKPDGQLALSMPYGVSFGFVQDPTHCNPCNEATWQYFDPDKPLYGIYRPKPWRITPGFPVWQVTGNMEVVLEKREDS